MYPTSIVVLDCVLYVRHKWPFLAVPLVQPWRCRIRALVDSLLTYFVSPMFIFSGILQTFCFSQAFALELQAAAQVACLHFVHSSVYIVISCSSCADGVS